MNLKGILMHQIKKEQIYQNIVKIPKKNGIIKVGIPIGIILGGTIIYLLKKGKTQND